MVISSIAATDAVRTEATIQGNTRREAMNRRKFLGRSVAGGVAIGGASALQNGAAQAPDSRSDLPSKFTPSAYSVPSTKYSPFTTPDYYTYADNLVIDRHQPGKPHAGKVLA